MSGVGIAVTLGGAVVVLLLAGVLTYMSQLIKNAYQIKIELQSELDTGLRRVEDDADKKLKWLKRDVFEELEKSKTALSTENGRQFHDLQEAVNRRFAERDELMKRERVELIKIIESQREAIRTLDQRLRALRREQRRAEATPTLMPDVDAVAEEPAEAAAEAEAVAV